MRTVFVRGAVLVALGFASSFATVRCANVSRGLGDACIRNEDCQSALCAGSICIAQPTVFDAAPPAVTPPKDAAAANDGAKADGSAVADTGAPSDAGASVDTGAAADTGAVADTGLHEGGTHETGPNDAGSHDVVVPADTGSPPDAGHPPVDSGSSDGAHDAKVANDAASDAPGDSSAKDSG